MISRGYPPDKLMIRFWNREPTIIDPGPALWFHEWNPRQVLNETAADITTVSNDFP